MRHGEERPVATGRVILGRILGASLLTTLGAMPVFLLGAQSTYIRAELGFGSAALGVAVGCFFAAAAIGALLFGRTADRLSDRESMALAGALCFSGGAGVALWSHSWSALVVWMVVLGFGNAACQVTANIDMARSIPPNRRGVGFAVKQSAVPVAVLLAGISVPVAAGPAGWRAPYLFTGLAGALVIAVAFRRRDSRSHRHARTADTDRPALAPLVLLTVAMTLASAAANAMASFIASWGHELGVSSARVGLVMAVGSALNVLVRLASGALADRRYGRNLPVVAGQMVIGGVAVLALSLGEAQIFWPVSVLAFAVGWSWPGLLMFAVVRVSRDRPGRASGMLQAGAFAGGAVGPVIFGFVVDSGSFVGAWRMAGAALLTAAALVLWARRLLVADLVARPPREPFGFGGGRRAPRRVVSRQPPPS